MIPVIALLLLAAFVVTIMSAMNKSPLWPAVLLLTLAALLQSSSSYLR